MAADIHDLTQHPKPASRRYDAPKDTDAELLDYTRFSAEAVLKHFNVAADAHAERDAIRFVFKEIADDNDGPDRRLERRKMSVEETIERIEYRLDLVRHFGPLFFPEKYQPDMDALVTAAICNGLVNDANVPIEAGGETIFHNDGIPDERLNRACVIWEEACEIKRRGIVRGEPPSREALCLAHINALDDLKKLAADFEDYEPEILSDLIAKDLSPIKKFAALETLMGAELAQQFECLAGWVKGDLPDNTPPPAEPPRPKLRLVMD